MQSERKPRHIARWDLDKTYLQTEFDTIRDLLRTALERADQKRTNPGAGTLLREMIKADISVHILSGSPEQMRRRLEDKLRLDGVLWDSFTLKPNLKNLLRLRFRAVRDQLGYKLPALLQARVLSERASNETSRETLFGDDAEADAFVYSLYADLVSGRVSERALLHVCEKGRMYPDILESVIQNVHLIHRRDVVERILIHLEKQTSPERFRLYGPRVVPFYNYLQAAFVLFEDGRMPAEGVIRVAIELVVKHRFDGDALARSYLELGRRGHLRGDHLTELEEALEGWTSRESMPEVRECQVAIQRIRDDLASVRAAYRGHEPAPIVDYGALVGHHNPRAR